MRHFWHKHGKLLAVLIGSIFVVGVTLWQVIRWANHPVTSTVFVASPRDVTHQSTTYQTLRTAYFSTLVPASWRIRERHDGVQPGRVQIVAFGPTDSSEQVGIVSDLLPSEGLAGIADYNLRKTSPDYALILHAGLPAGSQTFKKVSGGPEYTTFLTHGPRYASLTASGQTPDDAVLALLQSAVAHWNWTQ